MFANLKQICVINPYIGFYSDVFHNLTKEKEAVTFEDLESGLGNLHEITGIVYISADDLAPWLRNFTFLSKLRRIGGGVKLFTNDIYF